MVPLMNPAVLRALEFDRIVESVRGFALTPMGDERLARLAPSTDPQRVAQLLAATTEAARTRPAVAAKYEKRGRRYVQLRCDLEDHAGAKIGRVDSYIIWAPGAR